jgi:uncharacterized delta-60 repeat protein
MSGGRRAQFGRCWGLVLLSAWLAVLWTAAPDSVALAKKSGGTGKGGSTKKAAPKQNVAGRLDSAFGRGGKVMIPFPAEDARDVGTKYELPFQFNAGRLEMAPAPGGKIVVVGPTKVVRLLANGKLDRSFGTDGSAAIPWPPGQTFLLADTVVDSQGRVLIAGSARPRPTSSTPDPLIGAAMLVRFAADGSVDRSFAKEGMLVTDFGIEPPKIGPNQYPDAAVGLRSLVVDSQDRPVVTGGSVSEVVSCYSTEHTVSTAFVARLTEAGGLDPTFGEAGLRQIADLASFDQTALTLSEGLFTVGADRFQCDGPRGPTVVLTGFGPQGNLDPGFGFAGFRSVGYERPPIATVTPSGKILLVGPRRSGRQKTQLTMRLLPDGDLDPSFGRTGRVVILLPRGAALTSVAVDDNGRMLFAGRASKPVRRSGVLRSTFLLARMNPKGSFDRSFGRHGSVQTGFGGPSSSAATQLMVDTKGRIVVGGNVSTPRLPTGAGFALARYLTR